jgi:hypothetical protein
MEFKSILSSFCLTSGMDVNCQKSCFLAKNNDPILGKRIQAAYNIPFISMDKV